MNRTLLIVFALGILILGAASAPRNAAICITPGCQETGPVCVIDESGVPKTFNNRCLAELHGCRKRTYYVEVKPGAC